MGTQVSYKVEGGSSLGYEALPASKGPGVIVIQEYWGLVPHIKNVCDRFAAEGFVAVAPDLYHGQATKSPDEAGRLMMALNIDQAARDLAGIVKYLHAHPKVSSPKLGIVGFCMGGQLALYAASMSPEIAACVDFYGIHPKVAIDWKSLRCPVLGIFAEKDGYVTPQVAKKLEADMKAGGVKTDFTVYPGVNHAFFNDSRPEVYNNEAAEDAWQKAMKFFRENL